MWVPNTRLTWPSKCQPIDSFSEKYGPIGFFENFDDITWPDHFIKKYKEANTQKMKINLDLISSDHSEEKIKTDLIRCLID